jgi:hypothetical protein
MLNEIDDAGHGLCACGCGERTTIAPVSRPRYGHVRGQPVKFVRGHNRTRLSITADDYVVEDRGHETPCWIWSHHLSPLGYGRVGYRGKVALAHRVMYEQEVGPIPNGQECDHLCRQSSCIRPTHLEPVGHRENVRRGRAQKLTWEVVCAIRAHEGSSYTAAREFGISPAYAWQIRSGQRRIHD